MRFGGWLIATAALGACSPDYSAVRDWSVQARETVLPSPLHRVAPAPAAPAPAVAVTAEGRLGAVQALQEGAAAWLAALAYMADDGLLRPRENPLAALPPRVESFDPQGAAAITSIGDTMAYAARRNWRAPQLAYAVAQADPGFQQLMAALGRQAEALAAATPDARAEVEMRMAPLLAGARQPGARAALEEVQAVRLAQLGRRAEADAARRAAITRIAEGHALLAERASILSQSETARLLRVQESELRRLAAIIGGG